MTLLFTAAKAVRPALRNSGSAALLDRTLDQLIMRLTSVKSGTCRCMAGVR